MKSLLRLEHVTYTYPRRNKPSLEDINLEVQAGELLLLAGETGCGKSTLLQVLNGLVPQESGGRLQGKVFLDGQEVSECSVGERSQLVGMVFQSPDDQLISSSVQEEAAFFLENLGVGFEAAALSASKALLQVGLEGLEKRSVHALSGGQKQRLAVASVLAAQPRILALDEPISQLDPQGATELLEVLQALLRRRNTAMVLVEHRLHEALPLCTHIAMMQEGRIVWQGTREEALMEAERFDRYGLRLPQTVDVCRSLDVPAVLEVEEAVRCIQEAYPMKVGGETLPQPASSAIEPLPAVEAKVLSYHYSRRQNLVLQDLNLQINKGEFVALMGCNGAGKSTLLHLIAGLQAPSEGEILVQRKAPRVGEGIVGMVLQNPDFMLLEETVRAEVGGASGKLSPWQQRLLERLGLTGMEEEFPLALSKGQRLRVALAAVLGREPAVLLLDEPTTGQDIAHIRDIVSLLQEYAAGGGTVILCTHDTEAAACFAQRVVVLNEGKVFLDGTPAAVFSQPLIASAGLRAPAALLLAQELYGGKHVTVEEVVAHVRQSNMGSDARANAAAPTRCQS